MRRHLAIFSQSAIDAVFEGKKTVESRFSQKKIPPFGRVDIGDIVYIKPPGKEVVGQFRVGRVLEFQGLDQGWWKMIRERWGNELTLGSKQEDARFFESHKSAKYGTLIFIDRVEQFITSPIKVSKSDLRGWMVLE